MQDDLIVDYLQDRIAELEEENLALRSISEKAEALVRDFTDYEDYEDRVHKIAYQLVEEEQAKWIAQAALGEQVRTGGHR